MRQCATAVRASCERRRKVLVFKSHRHCVRLFPALSLAQTQANSTAMRVVVIEIITVIVCAAQLAQCIFIYTKEACVQVQKTATLIFIIATVFQTGLTLSHIPKQLMRLYQMRRFDRGQLTEHQAQELQRPEWYFGSSWNRM
jgi:hypothetical protein